VGSWGSEDPLISRSSQISWQLFVPFFNYPLLSKENSGSLLICFNLFRCYYNNSLGLCLAFLHCASSAYDMDFGDELETTSTQQAPRMLRPPRIKNPPPRIWAGYGPVMHLVLAAIVIQKNIQRVIVYINNCLRSILNLHWPDITSNNSVEKD